MRRLLAIPFLLLAACEQQGDRPLSPLAQEGKRVYQNVCIACHNGDPTKEGSLGPPVAGSSQALLEARVLHGSYPPGYRPKRPGSNVMPKFEYLADQIPALAAYLAEVDHSGG